MPDKKYFGNRAARHAIVTAERLTGEIIFANLPAVAS
jgi:hypothetical protein